MTYLATLADELHQLSGLLRASGEEIAQASRQVALAPVDRLGPLTVDAAGSELVGGASASLGRVAVALADVEELLHRLATGTTEVAKDAQ